MPQADLPSYVDKLPYTLAYQKEVFLLQIPKISSWPEGWNTSRGQWPRGLLSELQGSGALLGPVRNIDSRGENTQLEVFAGPFWRAPAYWEMTVSGTYRRPTRSSHVRGRIEVGFFWLPYAKVTYNSNGNVVAGQDTTTSEPYGRRRSILVHMPHDTDASLPVGDTVGCGYVLPGQFIFTKNGEVKDKISVQEQIYFTYLPHARLSLAAHHRTDRDIKVNFGQEPFAFNFGEYLKRTPYLTRVRDLAWRLPMEILEVILQHGLCQVDVDLDSKDPDVFDAARRVLGSLALVCRRWNTLCSRRIFGTMQLTGSADIQRVWRFHHLSTHERPDDPWLHHLLLSTPPRSLVIPREWTCVSAQKLPFMGGLPPRFSNALHSLPRRGHFAHIRKLMLERFEFPSWAQFARLAFGFSQLEELHLDDVSWGRKEIHTPPRWVRCSHRIGRISLKGSSAIASQRHGFVWLITCHSGMHPTPTLVSRRRGLALSLQDSTVIGRLVKQLCSWCPFDMIHYDVLDETRSCEDTFSSLQFADEVSLGTITCTRSGAVHLLLRLAKSAPMSPTYQLLSLHAMPECATTLANVKGYLKQLHVLLSRLSNIGDQTCRIRLLELQHDSRQEVSRWHIEASWQAAPGNARGEVTRDLFRRIGKVPMTLYWFANRTGILIFNLTTTLEPSWADGDEFWTDEPSWIHIYQYTETNQVDGIFVAEVPHEDERYGGNFYFMRFTLFGITEGWYCLEGGVHFRYRAVSQYWHKHSWPIKSSPSTSYP